jgi:transcriptional regulator with XRE-family HTH domain
VRGVTIDGTSDQQEGAMSVPVSARPGGPSRARRSLTRPLLRTVLGDVLRRVRLDQGRTLADVAAAAAISVPYLSEVERGRKEASSEVLAALCDALEVPLSAVVAEAGRDLAAELAEIARAERVAAVRELRSRPASAGSVAPAPVRSAGPAAGQALCLAA